jgi:hypothetical protein
MPCPAEQSFVFHSCVKPKQKPQLIPGFEPNSACGLGFASMSNLPRACQPLCQTL